MTADQLRAAFTGFFAERGHTVVPSSGLIPHHPLAPMFTNAGMNQFLPVFLGEERPAYPRATSVQKCARVRGKHDDIENIGKTTRHLTFFEMLGNFSFGDYFKAEAIGFAWQLLTDVLGIDGDRLWVTVHESDDEAAALWPELTGVPIERIQRMGADNFWEMGETGPCGPCSEIYYDKGEQAGPGGGPVAGGPERFVEIWNLVFMQYDRQPDGTLRDLPRKNIDTGAGLERILPILQGVESVFSTDVLRPLIAAAEAMTGHRYGAAERSDLSLRILADHARAVTFLVNDGLPPSNEDRGYVVRRIIRRAVRHAFQLGTEGPVLSRLAATVAEIMGGAYPDVRANLATTTQVIELEEERFARTLRSGLAILEDEIGAGRGRVSGAAAFRLHDTFGFPIDLTREIASERGVEVDLEGFDRAMEDQRRRARADRLAAAGASAGPGERADAYRGLIERFGPTEFSGYSEDESKARVLAVLPSGGDRVELFLDRTPFYAEAGGQVGDVGWITTETGTAQVLDTTYALPELRSHHARLVSGEILPDQEATATVDAERRSSIRRNHTGTHLLHWALREALGPHVRQAGSLVAPDRLRFDFSNPKAVSPRELAEIESMANAQVLANEPVRAYETSKQEAERIGAVAFFGEKYGDVVRVVEAGSRSVELCGGTHVGALGTIGPIKVVGESSIGANVRRIEAVTGYGSLERIRQEEANLARVATLLRVAPQEVVDRVERLLDEHRSLAEQIKGLRREQAMDQARELASEAVDGVAVARRDGLSRDDLRQLALAVRAQPGIRAVVLGGVPEGGGVGLVAAVAKESGLVASDLLAEAARTVGGGGGKSADVAVAGGRDPSRLDEALDQARWAAARGSAA